MNVDNTIHLEPYYDVAYNNERKYVELIEHLNNSPFQSFNGIVQKKYMFEQIRLVNERNWWIQEFFELWFNIYSKETLEHWVKCSVNFRIELNNAMAYYIQNDYLFPSEKSALKNFYIDLRRLVQRVKRRLKNKI